MKTKRGFTKNTHGNSNLSSSISGWKSAQRNSTIEDGGPFEQLHEPTYLNDITGPKRPTYYKNHDYKMDRIGEQEEGHGSADGIQKDVSWSVTMVTTTKL
jgi:hypothetical protein